MRTLYASVAIASALMSVAPALGYSVLDYDRITDTAAQIEDGSILPRLKKVYTNGQTGEFYSLQFDRALSILKGQYLSAVDAACATYPKLCK